ncbi:MAG: NUDIX domain-containing protein [Lachnospiraceae bacterium]|nr:NUDIX domain-containing protein [Lachnospiraceae bacterium]
MEWLDVVDENGNPTGETVERETAHAEGIRHRTAHVWIIRRTPSVSRPEELGGEDQSEFQILLQKRSPGKDSHPGCYDMSSGGHIPAGVDYLPSAVRELKEELGVEAKESDLIYCGTRHFYHRARFYGKWFLDNQVSRVYLLWADPKQFKLQESEVEEVRWVDLEHCLELLEREKSSHCISEEELEMITSDVKKKQQVS